MAITVYWACGEEEWIKAEQPEKVLNRFYKMGFGEKDFSHPAAINYCPVFNETFNRVERLAIINFETVSRDSIVPYIDCNHH